jgi:hypothetical protein
VQHTSSLQRRPGRAKTAMVFLLHQLIATLGIPLMAPFAVIVFADFARPFCWTLYMTDFHRVLTGTPYFPVQIVLALLLAFLLSRFIRHRSMLWVWILPFTILCCVVSAFPRIGQLVDPRYAALSSPSRVSHFFGWGCQPENRCLDQLMLAMPFYSASAYSIGAWLARRMGPPSSLAQFVKAVNRRRVALGVGLPVLCWFLASALLDLSRREVPQTMSAVCATIVWAIAESIIVTFLLVTLAGSPRHNFFLNRTQ